MKSIKDWKLQNEIAASDNPNWKAMRTLWGGNQQMADSRLMRALKVKVEQLKEEHARSSGFNSWAEVPNNQIQQFAQELSTTVLKLVLGSDAGAGRAVNVSRMNSMGNDAPTLPQDEVKPPTDWKG